MNISEVKGSKSVRNTFRSPRFGCQWKKRAIGGIDFIGVDALAEREDRTPDRT
jgi:hypothetical protein